MQNGGEISVTQALNKIQSWLNAGEFDKVIQGCQEILGIDPGNKRALALMKKAEDDRHAGHMPKVTEPAAEMQNTPDEPQLDSAHDPLAELAVEDTTTPAPEPQPIAKPIEEPSLDDFGKYEKHEKRRLFLAMIIPALLVVIVGGGLIAYFATRTVEEVTTSTTDLTIVDQSYLEENEDRIDAMTTMGDVIEDYKESYGKYPSVKQIEAALSSELSYVPVDPRHGEFDKSGKVFGYMYAVYDTSLGEKSAYVLSGLFEDSKGFGYAWSLGGSTRVYEHYRDTNQDNVSFIGGVPKTPVTDDEGPKVKTQE